MALALMPGASAFAQTTAGGEGASGGSEPQCVAIVLPSVHGVEGSAVEVAGTVRDLFAAYLDGPSIQAVSLEARLPSQAMEEAKQGRCTHMLTVTMTRKRSGGGGGGLGRALGHGAGAAAWHIPGGGAAGAAARSAASSAAHAAASMAATTRAKDELRLEYRLVPLDGRGPTGTGKAEGKAKVHGEDLLTPLVETLSERVLTQVLAARK